MKRFVVVLAFSACMMSLPTVEGLASTGKFASCAGLLKQYPAGVARDARAARQAVAEGMRRPAVNKAVYETNKGRLDRDKDGVACEQSA